MANIDKYLKAKWHCKDGRELTLEEMSLDHLRNCAAMIKREIEKVEHQAMRAFAYSGGEFAEMAADQAGGELMEEVIYKRTVIRVLEIVIAFKEKNNVESI